MTITRKTLWISIAAIVAIEALSIWIALEYLL